MNEKVIILVAHGSRQETANAEVQELARVLSESIEEAEVVAAFLDKVAKPNIPQMIDAAVADGSIAITILPYFLSPGVHVEQDIPNIVAEKQELYPNVSIEVLPYLGKQEEVSTLLERIIRNTL
jgi:sirohydrochlorin ferrochelatase